MRGAVSDQLQEQAAASSDRQKYTDTSQKPSSGGMIDRGSSITHQAYACAHHVLQHGSLPVQSVDDRRAIRHQGSLGEVAEQDGHRMHALQWTQTKLCRRMSSLHLPLYVHTSAKYYTQHSRATQLHSPFQLEVRTIILTRHVCPSLWYWNQCNMHKEGSALQSIGDCGVNQTHPSLTARHIRTGHGHWPFDWT